MPKLNQILAIESGTKKRVNKDVTVLHRKNQQPQLFEGLVRTYRPRDGEGVVYPPEEKVLQVRAEDQLRQLAELETEHMDLSFTKDCANQEAKADVVLGNGTALLKDVPVASLLNLEKKLNDIETFVMELPTLDPSEKWQFDEAMNCYASESLETTKTKKVPKNHVKAEATDKHPAQVEVFYEDVVEGFWSRTRFSGALSAKRKEKILNRVKDLKNAVKFAREQANSLEVTRRHCGKPLYDFLFAD